MAHEQLRTFLRRLRHPGPELGGVSDAQLLERFVTGGDEGAFEVLVWRHGGLVLHVCGRLLRQAEDVEDVFQATFLALTRSGRSIGKAEAVASWLYKVAYRLALRVRARAARDERQQSSLALPAPRPDGGELDPDVRAALDEEVRRLPEKYRAAVLLCYLEGKTTEEAGRQLGCARGTVCSRLAWARRRLCGRLTRRGLTLAAAGLAAALPPAAAPASACASPAPLVGPTVKAAVLFASGQAAGGALPAPAVALAEGVVRAMVLSKVKVAVGVLLVLGALGLGAGLSARRVPAEKPGAEEAPVLVRGSEGLRVPAGLLAKLGAQTAEVTARAAAAPRVLRLSGTLALDPTRVVRVRARSAPAEVLEVGQAAGSRELRPGDRVKKGDLLAVLFGVDVGSKKSDLFDALRQLALNQKILERAEKQATAVPEVFLLNARRAVQGDRNAVNRARNALRGWGIPEKEIDAVEEEARAAGEGKGKPKTEAERKARQKRWGRVELRAPEDGTLVERNVAAHEALADGTTVLFVLARLDRLAVRAEVSEDDLPALEALKPEQCHWAIRAKADPHGPPARGRIDSVGYLIDPQNHTAVVTGSVENLKGQLRPGQSVTASVTLPRPTGEVALPAAAVVEEGGRTFVFVQPDAKKPFYEQRRVLVVRRGHDRVHIRSRLTPEQERQGFKAVRPGERVVRSGALELKAVLDDLKGGTGR
jgi:cobalt-zinc-cadmium efflux system membrane fusion protein